MQTLGHLGVALVGDAERPELPESANPRGFFEHRDILREGLHAEAMRRDPAMLRGRAVKMALSPMVRRADRREWDVLESAGALLLPIRRPAEALLSKEILLRDRASREMRLKLFRSAVRNYLIDLGFLADRCGAPGRERTAPVCIDYRLATLDPAGYVARIARAAGLTPSAAQTARAIANIAPDLYRYRSSDGGAVAALAKGVAPLDPLHETLRADDPSKWTRLRALLPSWVAPAI